MTIYLIKRLFLIILIVLVVVFALFFMLSTLAGSRIGTMPVYGYGDALDSVFDYLDVGNNLITKFVRYSYNVVVHGDFGKSQAGFDLGPEMTKRTNITLIMLACGGAATLVIGIPAGIYAAIKKDSLWDRAMNVVTLILSSIPSYAMALIIALLLVLQLRLLPMMPIPITPGVFIMPTITIALGGISYIARITRTSMLEVLDQPYITALRAKGLKETSVVLRHALKNAMVPVISVMGGLISQLLCGAFVVEQFFNIRGLGSMMIRSIGERFHYEMLGATVMMTVILAAINIVSDALYVIVNPRFRLQHTKTRNNRLGKG